MQTDFPYIVIYSDNATGHLTCGVYPIANEVDRMMQASPRTPPDGIEITHPLIRVVFRRRIRYTQRVPRQGASRGPSNTTRKAASKLIDTMKARHQKK